VSAGRGLSVSAGMGSREQEMGRDVSGGGFQGAELSVGMIPAELSVWGYLSVGMIPAELSVGMILI
jgi:hypothetical protein